MSEPLVILCHQIAVVPWLKESFRPGIKVPVFNLLPTIAKTPLALTAGYL